MSKPLVSIVMITYGHEQFIKQAIEGVLMQQCVFEVEFIIANDCSPDNTDTVVDQLSQSNPNSKWIKYTTHTVNKGMIFNFIWALKQAKGKYIALCEGDDYWTDPSKLQKQVDFLEMNEDYVACSGIALNSFTNEFVHKIEDIKTDLVLEDFVFNSPIITGTVMFRNTNFEGFAEFAQNHKINDWILWLYLILKSKSDTKIKYFKERFSVYRIHNGGVFSQLSNINFHKYYFNHLYSVYQILTIYNNDFALEFKEKLKDKRLWHSIQIYRILLEEKKYLKALQRLVKIFLQGYPLKRILNLLREFKNALK
jgi:glycosyltransferase involved in cell wall biosynthesis